ncbi:MAG: RDD family protein [Armatimonas sp.]
MAREIVVVTPENIPLRMELAGLGSRFGALLIDITIIGGVLIPLWFMVFPVVLAVAGGDEGLTSILIAIFLIATFLLVFGHFIVFEMLWSGQTPGKRALGLRAIDDAGFPITFFQAAARNLIRIADFLPMGYIGGAICAFSHKEYKRLGDIVAGTVVIKERSMLLANGAPVAIVRPRPKNIELADTVLNPVTVLSDAEKALVQRFAARRPELLPEDAERIAYRIVAPMAAKLNLRFAKGQPPRYSALLLLLARRLEEAEDDLV